MIKPIAFYRRRGLTLLELLVVLFIVSILMAAAIPVLRPRMQTRALREASRSVSTALGMARTKAMQTGNYWGVMFEPLGTAGGAVTAHFVEVPPPYSGDFINSRLHLEEAYLPAGGEEQQTDDGKAILVFDVDFPLGDSWQSFVTVGSLLRLNHQNQFFRVEEPLAATQIRLSGDFITNDAGQLVSPRLTLHNFPGGTHSPEYAFQFFPPPIKAALNPITMPNGAIVDLLCSGIGDGTYTDAFIANPGPVMITFAPNGQLDLVYHPGRTEGERPASKVHVLIGKPGQYGQENVVDLENLWVAVDQQTGMITSTENACIDLVAPIGECDDCVGGDCTTTTTTAQAHAAREYARSGQKVGG